MSLLRKVSDWFHFIVSPKDADDALGGDAPLDPARSLGVVLTPSATDSGRRAGVFVVWAGRRESSCRFISNAAKGKSTTPPITALSPVMERANGGRTVSLGLAAPPRAEGLITGLALGATTAPGETEPRYPGGNTP